MNPEEHDDYDQMSEQPDYYGESGEGAEGEGGKKPSAEQSEGGAQRPDDVSPSALAAQREANRKKALGEKDENGSSKTSSSSSDRPKGWDGWRPRMPSRRRAFAIGGSISGIIAIVALVAISNFLAIFKLTTLQKGIDEKRMARLTHVFDKRSDRFIASLIDAEIAGTDGSGHNRYFQAKGYYSNGGSPIVQWYKDMRTQNFFDYMQKEQGVRFVRNDQDRLVKIETGGREIDFSEALKKGDGFVASDVNGFEDLVKTEYSSNKEARIAFNNAIKASTKRREIIKRHNMRLWGYERLGIRKWKFFEGTRDKVREKVRTRWLQAVDTVFEKGTFVNCLLNIDNCPKSDNLNDDSNKPLVDSSSVDPSAQEDLQASEDEAGTKVTKAGEMGRATRILAAKLTSKVLKAGGIAGNISTLETIDKLASGDLVKLVAVMRSAEYASSYFSYNTITDNLKDGHTPSAEEVGAVSEMFNGVEQSETYNQDMGTKAISNTLGFNSKAYAADTTPTSADAAEAQRNSDSATPPFAAVSDNLKVGSDGSTTSKITHFYLSTVGAVIHPIVQAYEAIPGPKLIVDTINSIFGAVLTPLINAGLSVFDGVTGLDVQAALGKVFEHLIADLGGAPACDPSQSGGQKFNCADMGGAVVQEAVLQSLGGQKLSDPQVHQQEDAIAMERADENSVRSTYSKIADLNEPDSVLTQVLMKAPSSAQDVTDGVQTAMATIVSPLSIIHSQLSLTMLSAIFTPSYAATPDYDPNIAGVKRYGPTEDQLNEDP